MCTKGLDSDLSYTTADTGAGLFSNWICIAWEQVYVCSAIKLQLSFIPFQNAFIKLKKNIYFFLILKESWVIIHYLWFYFIGERELKIAQRFYFCAIIYFRDSTSAYKTFYLQIERTARVYGSPLLPEVEAMDFLSVFQCGC